MTFQLRSGVLARFAIAICVVLITTGGSAYGSVLAHKKVKTLSMPNVTIIGDEIGFFTPVFVAQSQGYYSKLGLNVTFLNITTSGADVLAAMLAGSGEFDVTGVINNAVAVSTGAPVRDIMTLGYGQEQEIALNATWAAQHGITSSQTPEKQLSELKGTNVTIAASNTSSDGYHFALAIFKFSGLTVGPTGDVNLSTVGSGANQVAVLNSGKVNGIISTPPNTTQPNTLLIEAGNVPPLNVGWSNNVYTLTSMIQSHSDVVQAVVTGMVEGYQFTKQHPSQALADSTPMFANSGFTSQSEVAFLFQHYRAHMTQTPALTRVGYASLQKVLNVSLGYPYTVRFSLFIDNKFVDNSIKTLHLRYVLGPV